MALRHHHHNRLPERRLCCIPTCRIAEALLCSTMLLMTATSRAARHHASWRARPQHLTATTRHRASSDGHHHTASRTPPMPRTAISTPDIPTSCVAWHRVGQCSTTPYQPPSRLHRRHYNLTSGATRLLHDTSSSSPHAASIAAALLPGRQASSIPVHSLDPVGEG
jgi:hypothetical protein